MMRENNIKLYEIKVYLMYFIDMHIN